MMENKMTEKENEFYIDASGTSSGRYVRTHARSSIHEFVLVSDTVNDDIRLHVLADRPMSLVGLYFGDVQAIKKCCDLFLEAHAQLKKEGK